MLGGEDVALVKNARPETAGVDVKLTDLWCYTVDVLLFLQLLAVVAICLVLFLPNAMLGIMHKVEWCYYFPKQK
eukprot:1749172-Ditylum_brightwellii.AAC.1